MLCAPEPVFAQAAHHSLSTHSNNNNNDNSNNSINNHFSSSSRSIPLLHDPYDPRIEQEYEQLVQHWTRQLLNKSRYLYSNYNNLNNVSMSEKNHSSSMRHISSSHINDTNRNNNNNNNNSHSKASIASSSSEGLEFTTNVTTDNHLCCTDIIDHYLEEQWRDSQHMLKCAQMWNGRESLDIGEAVRAMNIISLRLMQRTLETRQMIQNSNDNSVHDHNGHRKQKQQHQQQQEYTPLFSPWVSPPRPGHHDHIRSNSISNSSIISSSDEDGSVRWRPRHSPSLASLPKVPVVQDAPKGFVANKGTTVPSISLSLSSPMSENNSNKGDHDDDDYEEEQEMYAPLLRRYQTDSSISGGCDGSNNSISSISDWTHDKLKKKPSLQTIEQHAAAAIATSASSPYNSNNSNNSHCSRRPLRLVPSPSAPSHSSLINGTCCSNSFKPATNYHRYYPEQRWNDENEEYEYDYSSEDSNNDDGTNNKQQQQHNQWKSWFHHQHSHRHHYHQEEQGHLQQQQQQPLLLPLSPSSPCVFCYNPVPKKCLSAGDVEETRFFPSSTSGDSSTEDNQSASYHSAVASDHVILEEIEEYYDENNNNEVNALLAKSTTFFDSNKYLDEQDQADPDDKYNNVMTNYGILGTSGGSNSSSNSGGGMIRNESSISAFRPISKNLAPRCSAALVRDKSISTSTSKQFIYRDSLSSSSSSSSTNPAGVDNQQFNTTKGVPIITKSQSFPTKVAAMSIESSTFSDSTRRPALPKMASYSTPRPIGGTGSEKRSSTNNNKERNFVMRSIVSKKASLSKLFHAKKY